MTDKPHVVTLSPYYFVTCFASLPTVERAESKD